MTSKQFKAWCNKHGLSTEQSATVLGCSRAQAYKYAAGSQAVNLGITKMCKLLDTVDEHVARSFISLELHLSRDDAAQRR